MLQVLIALPRALKLLAPCSVVKASIGLARTLFPFRLGIGVQRDSNASLEYCKKAAEEPHNYPASQRQLGIAFFDGTGVQQDYHEATHWFQQATQRNDIEVCVYITSFSLACLVRIIIVPLPIKRRRPEGLMIRQNSLCYVSIVPKCLGSLASAFVRSPATS